MTGEAPPPVAAPEALTRALRAAGLLEGDARVGTVAVSGTTPTRTARVLRLGLTVEGAAPGAPRSLILKTARPDRPAAAGVAPRHEAAFYRDIAPSLPAGLVPRCFAADGSDAGWHVLLEDLSDSHDLAAVWPLPPRRADADSMVATLARFHAAWWDDPRLHDVLAKAVQPEVIAGRVATLEGHYRRFADSLGDRLTPPRRRYYERFLEAAPRLLLRPEARHRRTFAHGDAHAWNFLLPRPGTTDGVRLIDWSTWHLGTGSDDLAYLMALHWSPDLRREREGPLLDRYHAALRALGIPAFDRAALDEDYRVSVLLCSSIPLLQHGRDGPPAIWWHHLEHIHLAIDDLGAGALLDDYR